MTRKNGHGSSVALAFAAVTTLFFAWGFITSLVDPLVAAVKGIFVLSDVEAQLSAFAFFIAYGVISMPAAALLSRMRAVPAMLVALMTMIAGCLVMLGAANLSNYVLVLGGLFILASGITILQVTANPLAAALGDPRGSHFRLTLCQTFNSFGTVIGPILGAHLFLRGVEVHEGVAVGAAIRANALAGIDSAYFWISGLIAALAFFFYAMRRIVGAASPASMVSTAGPITLLRRAIGSRWALFGATAIFLYVGAEVSIGTQMALFLHSDTVWGRSDALFSLPFADYIVQRDGVPGLSLEQAGKAVALYWGGAMIGRAVGSLLLARLNAARLLAVFAATACAMCLWVVIVGGVSAGFVAIAIGFFNSIMFPVIFTLTLERSSAGDEATSGLLCTAIIGGAFVPLATGAVSGVAGYAIALAVPAACYALLLAFAWAAARAPAARMTG